MQRDRSGERGGALGTAADPPIEAAPLDVVWTPGVDDLRACLQCGTCSAVCPMSDYMDLLPRQMVAMLHAGRADEVVRDRSIWVCTSCYACTVECPKQIPITDAIYALKRESMRGRLYPRRFPSPVMVRAFVDSVDRRGRSTESWISVSLYLQTRPFELLRNAPLALRLLRAGRMSFRRESSRDRRQIRRMLAALEPPTGAA
jgi:quinone-modifying oxidoreductase subunit QmoC